MADRFIVSNIQRLPQFSRLPMQQLQLVADAAQTRRYEAGETLYRQGDLLGGMIMFVNGGGALTQVGPDGIERPFGVVSPNEYLHEGAMYEEQIAPVTLRATASSIVLFIARQQMRSLLTYHPEIKANLVQTEARATAAPPSPDAFKEKRENETVLIQTRRHWWSFGWRWLLIMLVIVILWTADIPIQRALPGVPVTLIVIGVTGVLVLAMLYILADWMNDKLVVSDRRVVKIQRDLRTLGTRINELPLDGIHEINVSLPPLADVIGRLLGYGTLIVKTSGDAPNMRIEGIPNPQALQKLIFSTRKELQDQRAAQNRNAARSAIRSEIDRLTSGEAEINTVQTGSAANSPAPGTPGVPPGLFSTRYVNEKGDTVYRKHLFIWLIHVTAPTVLLLAGVFLFLVGLIGPILPLVLVGLGGIGLYLADWDWRNDLYIIGDPMITIIHRRPLFLQDQKDQVLLNQVDNVVSEMQGFVSNLLQMGEVRLLLSGMDEKSAKRIVNVFQPQRIQQEISRRQDLAEEKKQQEEAARQRQTIVDYLSVYHESEMKKTTLERGMAAPQSGPTVTQPYIPPNTTALPPTGNYGSPVLPQSPAPYPPSESETRPRVRDRARPPGIPRPRPDDRPPRLPES